ncbi:hypothetical protein ABS735_29285 [Streptomyces sp. MMCC 100]|uniref:hypothetical protein n=1 Tax=Streptomyces sp. MMCC 100 TaxID=3163555 RepID=UPI003595CA95
MASRSPRVAAVPVLVLAVLALAGACDSPSPAPPVGPPSEDPAGATSPSQSTIVRSGDGPVVVGPAPEDLREVEWAEVPTPGEFCGVPELLRFGSGSEVKAASTTWGTVRVFRSERFEYGDTDGDRRDEAAVYVACRDTVTMNAQITSGYVVYARVGDDLAVLGSITPRRKDGAYPTQLTSVEFAPGRIIVHEKWFRPNDAHCCPSGDATTVWLREADRLTPGTTRVTS